MTERLGVRSRVVIATLACAGLASCYPNPAGTCATGACPDATQPPSPCANGVKDGDETDVDCGGPACRKCAGSRTCMGASDCANGNCVAGTCSALTTVSFADAVFYDSGLKTYAIRSADLDGDGDIDLVAANEEENSIAVFRNVGASSGTFVKVDMNVLTGEYPTGGAIADFNGDGIPDVITADYHGNSVSILLGQGTGDAYRVGAHVSYPTAAGAETSNLAVGDLNGDGIVDVIATNPQAHSISVFLGRGDGTLGPTTNLTLSHANFEPSQPYSVAIGDFDGDGHNDAAMADDASGTVYLEYGNGDGTFRPGPQPGIGGGPSYILIAHDMDSDGLLDLVIANRSTDNVSVLLGRGVAGFDDGLVSTTGPGGPYTIAVADFNLDGVPDLVTPHFMTENTTVMLGIGNGKFDAPIDTGITGMASYGVAVGDFNGDGKPDFAIANAVSDDIAIKLNTSH